MWCDDAMALLAPDSRTQKAATHRMILILSHFPKKGDDMKKNVAACEHFLT